MYQVIATENGKRVVLAGGFDTEEGAESYAENMRGYFGNEDIQVERWENEQ